MFGVGSTRLYIHTHTPHTVLTVWRPGRTPVDSGCRSPPSTPFPAASSAVYPASVASVWSSAMLNTPPSLPRPAMQKIWIKIWIFYPQLSKPFTKHLHTTHLFSSLLLAVFTVCVGKLFLLAGSCLTKNKFKITKARSMMKISAHLQYILLIHH